MSKNKSNLHPQKEVFEYTVIDLGLFSDDFFIAVLYTLCYCDQWISKVVLFNGYRKSQNQWISKVALKDPPKWRKCESFRGNRLRGWRPERAMDQMDRPRTSIDERMLSGRRAVVIV